MELEAGARAFLLSQPVVTGYVVDKVWKHKLEDVLDGTGGRAIVLKRAGGWTSPQQRNTQEYPKLRVELWADQERNADGTVKEQNGLTSALAMFRAVDPLLHGVRDVRWGELFVIGCSRWSEPLPGTSHDTSDVAGENGSEASMVFVDYAVQLIH